VSLADSRATPDATDLGLLRAEEAGREIYDDPSAAVYEPVGDAECAAAVAALAECFAAAGGTVAQIVENSRAGAQGLSDDRLQGLSEIVQNADDAGATEVQFIQSVDALYAIHDGAALTLRDAHALAAPWLTTKRDQAPSTGRFGVGLLTLHALAESFEIHSGGYHLSLGAPTLDIIDVPPMPEAVRPGDTVVRVPLAADVLRPGELMAWCSHWDDSSLLFLNSVRKVTFSDWDSHRSLSLRTVDAGCLPATVGDEPVEANRRRVTAADGRTWTVYDTEVPRPPGLSRAHKKTAATTPLAVALPSQGSPSGRGRLYAGLPVVGHALELCANAQFDPVTSRQGFVDTPWNTALASRVADLWAAAVLDQFQNHTADVWPLLPLPEDETAADSGDEKRPGLVRELELDVRQRTDTAIPAEAKVQVAGQLLPIPDLAVEQADLEELLTEDEVATLAEAAAALPRSCRDVQGRWRRVLSHWRAVGVPLPEEVSVLDALPLVEQVDRSAESTIRLAAAAIASSLEAHLARRRCIVLHDGQRCLPPAPSELRVLTAEDAGLAATLKISQRLGAAYLAESADAERVRDWLSQRDSLLNESREEPVIARISLAGDNGQSFPAALTDVQVRAIRDALEPLGHTKWEKYGSGLGRAIKLEGFRFDARGKTVPVAVTPATAYQPKSIDKDSDSFAVAADTTPGINWLAGKYATVLRSSLGRAGLGAQRFVRLLGADTAPRLEPHPRLHRRFSDPREGVSAQLSTSPPARSQALRDRSATYTLNDRYSPDLERVLEHIARDRKPTRRRQRAAAIIAVLGRAWPTLSEFAEVPAAQDHYGWQLRGPVKAWWLWQAGTTPWLDNGEAQPRAPLSLRLRTPATIAVHGDDKTGFLHPAFAATRTDVLAALGIAGEPDSQQLVTRLRQLRETSPPVPNAAAEAAVVYQALADRLQPGARSTGDLTAARVRQLFSVGTGLVLTRSGWKPPVEVLRGPPIFGPYRTFVPQIPGVEPLWTLLQIRTPDLDDCLGVLASAAKQSEPDDETLTVVLETLRLVVHLVGARAPQERQVRRLAQLPLWTTKGWVRGRPVLAVEEPALAAGIGATLPVWLPGGDLAQFQPITRALRLHQVESRDTQVVAASDAYVDDEATALFADAVQLLREDLARNDPTVERSIRVDWDDVARFEVRVAENLQVLVRGLPTPAITVRTAAKVDAATSTLYLEDVATLGRVEGGGRALANLFQCDARRLAQAWLAAVEAAREGREAKRVRLAEERAAEEVAASRAAIAEKLAQVQEQAKRRQAKTAPPPRATSTRTPPADPASGDTNKAQPTANPRTLVDAESLEIVNPGGTLVTGTPQQPPKPQPKKAPLPPPNRGGAAPRERSTHRAYSDLEKERLGLELVRRVLGSNDQDMIDLRAQHGVGADAVDELSQYYELKVSAGPEPDEIVLEDSQIRRAMSTDDFFLVVVSGLEGANATPKVRVIVNPLSQLRMSERSQVRFAGVRQSHSLVYDLKPKSAEAVDDRD
jgi:hypothetical protein